jgi:hypothetical protein
VGVGPGRAGVPGGSKELSPASAAWIADGTAGGPKRQNWGAGRDASLKRVVHHADPNVGRREQTRRLNEEEP